MKKLTTEPQIVIINEIRIQNVLYNGEITICVINKSKIDKKTCNEMLQIANLIIQNFKQ